MYGKVDRILTREYHGQMFTEEKLFILPYVLDTLRDLVGCHRWAIEQTAKWILHKL